MSAPATSEHGHPPNIKLYLVIFGALLVLTVVTVLVSYVHLAPAAAIGLGLAIATFKAGLVAAFFMHLKGEHKLIYIFLGLTALTILGFLLMPLDFHLLRDVSEHVEVVGGHGQPGSTHDTEAPH